jgi:ribosomal protein S18 acetylase RimI-like enzyme
MSVMVEHSRAVAHHLPDLELGESDRRVIARFMAQQFFKNLSRETREQIASATESAVDLELLSFRNVGGNRIVGALMLSRTPGVLGLYNLCVDQGDRDRGIGRRMVRHVVTLAALEGRLVTLQCDATLVPWYRDQGFRELTELHVWSVSC